MAMNEKYIMKKELRLHLEERESLRNKRNENNRF